MPQKIYQVDAFANKLFEGNPAAFCLLDEWLSDQIMQRIAMENNLAETAFVVKKDDGNFDLRWFTPTVEVDLCGHATLASAHILFQDYGVVNNTISFDTRSGRLKVQKIDHDRYLMDFPCDTPRAISDLRFIKDVIDTDIIECYKGKDDYLLIVKDEAEVIATKPNYAAMKKIESRGILVSATGNSEDFVSRCFFPNAGVDEDPVTGSAHTLLTPYWAHRLNKNRMNARQLSSRGGDIECIYKASRVALIGSAVTYMKGEIYI